MARSTKLCFFCALLSLCVLIGVRGGEHQQNYETDYKPGPSFTHEELKNRRLPILLRKELNLATAVATECKTPDDADGYCIEIKLCQSLLKLIQNEEAAEFIRASRCGPPNESMYNPKVCCRAFDLDDRNINTVTDKEISVEDKDVLPKSCGRQKPLFDRRITGGKQALLGEYPWLARIVYKNEMGLKTMGCSGFLIHPNFLLTAAHCTHPQHIGLKGSVDSVILGEHDSRTEIDCSSDGKLCAKPNQVRRVSKVIIHPHYNPENRGHYNDIAVIHLKRAAQMSDFVQPICLWKDDAETPLKYEISGWGKTEKVLISNIKMKIEVPSFAREKCEEKYSVLNVDIIDTQICAGGEGVKDSCTGDSGGPLMTSTGDGIWYASGVVSFGISCGRPGWPGVYTSIAKFLPWIKKEMALSMSKGPMSSRMRQHRKRNA